MPFEWTPSLTLTVSSAKCLWCEGTGMRFAARRWKPCSCALRGAFRCCYDRWIYVQNDSRICQIQYGIREQPSAQAGFSMPDLEYAADFVLLAKRHLTSPAERAIFQLHFLEQRDWRECCRRLDLGLDRGSFYHAVYRIEERMGRVYAETRPYPLFPLESYFSGVRYKPDTSLPASSAPVPLHLAA